MKKLTILLLAISLFSTALSSCSASYPQTAEEVALTFAEAWMRYDFKTVHNLATDEFSIEIQKWSTSHNESQNTINEHAQKFKNVKITCTVNQFDSNDEFYTNARERGETAFSIDLSCKDPDSGESLKTDMDVFTVFVDGKWKVTRIV